MSTDVQSRAEVLFYEALERPAGEREAFLNNACGADVSVRAELDELLRAHDGAAGFLQVDAPASPELEAEFARLKPEEAGERIGNYKLLEQIGEGGFGTVWVAEQEKPMRRRVALKIIKLGMDTKAVIARFEQERQALAMMDHPNIAKVLEAGATPLGRPFFVMELVRGVKITEYCDQANLPTEERLQLFIAVCHAVQHAHQKGIIHRDLKPSNILVTLHDGVPVPKVIDFGVAKATQQQRLTDLTVYTQFEQMIGTPLYMSPEQAEMSGLDVDTRSDIYSLGVLLYELLTGHTPFDPEELMRQGLDEIRRVIREQEAQRPSTFVSTMALDLRTNLAQRRQTDSARLIGQIRGDLDWIVMRALEKDRTRRYETANGLAQDIQRHLLSEPVQARPASQLYRFRRFAKRNKLAFAAGSAVLAALIIGLGVSTWMFFKERDARERAVTAEKAQSQERKKAETEAGKSRQVAQFLTDMLKGVGPAVALGRDTKLLREIMDKTAERLGKDLKDQPEVEADLRSIIGDVYRDLGAVGQVNGGLGASGEQAWAMHSEALAIRKRRFGNEHPDVADSLASLAQLLWSQGKEVEAETMAREALAMNRKLLGNEHLDVAKSMIVVSQSLHVQGKQTEAESFAREALAMIRRLRGNGDPDVATALRTLAQAVGHQGRATESEALHREGLDILRKLYGNEHPAVTETLYNLAQSLRDQDKLAESKSIFREVLAMGRKLYGNENPLVDATLDNLVGVLLEQHNFTEAEAMNRERLASARSSATTDPRRVEARLNDLAEYLFRQGKFAEAEPLYREIVARRRARLPAEDDEIIASMVSLARLLTDWAWSERGSSTELRHVSRTERDRLPKLAMNGSAAAGSKPEITERAHEAEHLLRECLASRLDGSKANQWRTTGETRSRLGGAVLAVAVTDSTPTGDDRLAKFTEAESLLLEGNEVLQHGEKVETKYKRDSFKAESRNKRDSFTRLVRLYEAWNKPDKAADWRQKLADFDKAEAEKTEAVSPEP